MPFHATQYQAPSVSSIFGNISRICFTDDDDGLLRRSLARLNSPVPTPPPPRIPRQSVFPKIHTTNERRVPQLALPQMEAGPNASPNPPPPAPQSIFGNISRICFTDDDDGLLRRSLARLNSPLPTPPPPRIPRQSVFPKIPTTNERRVPQLALPQMEAGPNASPNPPPPAPGPQSIFGNISRICFTDDDDELLRRSLARLNPPHELLGRANPTGIHPPRIPRQSVFPRIMPTGSQPAYEGRVPQLVWPHPSQMEAAPNSNSHGGFFPASHIQGDQDVHMDDIADDMDVDPAWSDLLSPHTMDVDDVNSDMPMDVDSTVLRPLTPIDFDQPLDATLIEASQAPTLSDGATSIVDPDPNPDHGDDCLHHQEADQEQAVVLYNRDQDPVLPDDEISPPNLSDPPVNQVEPDLVDRCDLQPGDDQMDQLIECFYRLDIRDDNHESTPISSSSEEAVHEVCYESNFEWLVEPVLLPSTVVSYTDLLEERRGLANLDELASETVESGSETPSSSSLEDASTEATSTGSPSLCLDTPPTRPAFYKNRTNTSRPRDHFFSGSSNATPPRYRFPQTRRVANPENSGPQRPRPTEWRPSFNDSLDDPFGDTSWTDSLDTSSPCPLQKKEKTKTIIPHTSDHYFYPTPGSESIQYRRRRPNTVDWESSVTVTPQTFEIATSSAPLENSCSGARHRRPSAQLDSSETKATDKKPVFPGAYTIEEQEESDQSLSDSDPEPWIPWILRLTTGW